MKVIFLNICIFQILTLNLGYATELNLKTWSKLSMSEKIDVLDNEGLESKELRYKNIKNSKFKEAVDEMTQVVLDEASQDYIESSLYDLESIFTIGEPRPAFITIYLLEEKPIALSLGLIQDGGEANEGTPPKKHYETSKEAKNAGLNAGADVQWQVHSYFEWNEKTWKTLKIDIHDEGGFSWSGW